MLPYFVVAVVDVLWRVDARSSSIYVHTLDETTCLSRQDVMRTQVNETLRQLKLEERGLEERASGEFQKT